MTYVSKKQLNSRRSTIRNGLKAERERASSAQRLNAMNILRWAASREDRAREQQSEAAVLYGTADMANKVLTAFGVNVPLRVSSLDPRYATAPLRAYTTFREITVMARTDINLQDLEQVANYVFMVKGAVYHEGGHCKYTIPFNDLVSGFQVSDANDEPEWRVLRPRWNAQFNPALGHPSAVALRELQRCWNILEDQRMEMAMYTESPVLGNYFTNIVLNVVINKDDVGSSWPFVSGRMYLDYNIRKSIRDLAMQNPKYVPIIKQIDSVIARYRVAKTHTDLLRALFDFYDLMKLWGTGLEDQHQADIDNHSHQYNRNRGTNEVQPVPEMDGSPGEYPDSEPGQADGEGEGEGEGGAGDDWEGEGDQSQQSSNGNSAGKEGDEGEGASGGDGDEDEQSPNEASSPSHDATGPVSSGVRDYFSGKVSDPTAGKGKNDVRDLIKEAIERTKPKVTQEVMNFVSKINEEIRQNLPRDPTSRAMPADMEAKAHEVKQGVINALEHLIDQTAPAWRFRQEDGVLDPTAYVLREPGDTDYWSNLNDNGGQGYDLAVSVVLDTSYSMEYQMVPLSIAALGIRLACDDLGIPCDVSTFNSGEYALYRADEKTVPTTVHADGGTEPARILSMLESQQQDKKKHLVLILTDGEWSDCPSLSPYSAPGRYFLLLGLGMYNDAVLANKRPNAYLIIRDIMEMPKQFTRALAGFMA